MRVVNGDSGGSGLFVRATWRNGQPILAVKVTGRMRYWAADECTVHGDGANWSGTEFHAAHDICRVERELGITGFDESGAPY